MSERSPWVLSSEREAGAVHAMVDETLRGMFRATCAMPMSPGLAGMLRLFAAEPDADLPAGGAASCAFAARTH